jgi:hypothetical protein
MFWIPKYLQRLIHVWNKSNGRIMSKLVGNEYNTKILHIVYGNNHFEPTIMHNQIAIVVNVYNCNINNQTSKHFETKENKKKVQHKRKGFSSNFELNNALLKMVKMCHEWIEQEVALAFIHHYPRLGLNMLQIKQHLKHLRWKSKESNVKRNICLKEKEIISGKISQNYKNDDLEYVSKNNETNTTFFTNITKKM